MVLNLDNGRYIRITIKKNEKGIFEYYNNGALIGIYNPNVMKDNKFMAIDLERSNTLQNELSAESKDEIKQIVEEIQEKMNEISIETIEEEANENKAIDGYLQEHGIEREKVKSITIMDLDRDEKQKNDTKSEASQEKIYTQENNINNSNQINKVTTSDVNIKQEIDLEERATDVQDMKRWLGNNIPSEFQKIGVIETDEMSKMKNENGEVIDKSTTRYGLVLIGKDGQVEPLKKYIPQLEQNHSSGNNPIESQYQIDTDGTVEKDAVLSEYRIGNKIIQLDQDHLDDFEVNIGKYSPYDNDLVTTRMRDKNTQFATRTEARKAAMGDREGVYESTNSYKEAQEEPEELTYEEIDGEPDTGHTHFSEEQFEKCVEELMDNGDINEVFTENEIRERLAKNILGRDSESKNIEDIKKAEVESIESIKEQTRKELEEDASHFQTRGERN